MSDFCDFIGVVSIMTAFLLLGAVLAYPSYKDCRQAAETAQALLYAEEQVYGDHFTNDPEQLADRLPRDYDEARRLREELEQQIGRCL